jgi:hypothetical protein
MNLCADFGESVEQQTFRWSIARKKSNAAPIKKAIGTFRREAITLFFGEEPLG